MKHQQQCQTNTRKEQKDERYLDHNDRADKVYRGSDPGEGRQWGTFKNMSLETDMTDETLTPLLGNTYKQELFFIPLRPPTIFNVSLSHDKYVTERSVTRYTQPRSRTLSVTAVCLPGYTLGQQHIVFAIRNHSKRSCVKQYIRYEICFNGLPLSNLLQNVSPRDARPKPTHRNMPSKFGYTGKTYLGPHRGRASGLLPSSCKKTTQHIFSVER